MALSPWRVVFMGSPDFAVPSLRVLIEAGYQVVGVYTQPDSPVGRGRRSQATAIKRAASHYGLPVFQPQSLRRPDAIAEFQALGPDLLVIAAFGQILSRQVLDIPPHGSMNVHASLLPRYRGASPVATAILDGAPETGVSLMLVDEGLDTGPVLAQRAEAIAPDDTAGSLSTRLAVLGSELLLETLPLWMTGRLTPRPQQSEQATTTRRIRKEDGMLNWSLSAEVLERRIRAFDPWPGATTSLDGTLVRVVKARTAPGGGQAEPGAILPWRDPSPKTAELPRAMFAVQTGNGLLLPLLLQKSGKRVLSAVDFANGERGLIGRRFGNS